MGIFRTRCLARASAFFLLGSLLFASTVAAAQNSSFLSMSSQSGDYIGQGQSYYFTPATATFSSTTYDGSLARFAVIEPGNGDWWYVTIAAAPGQPLVEGTYTNAVRAEFRGAGQPGVDVYGDGRGCNTLIGSFTVLHALYGANNTVLQFDATFVQNCEGFMPPLTGEIRYDATPALALQATVNAAGTVVKSSARATVSGTVTCSLPVTATVSGTVSEPVKKGAASASFSTAVACTGSPTAWSAAVMSTTGRPFAAGTAQVSVSASAADPFSGQQASATAGGSVTLALVR